ncbi:ribosomal protein S13, partial [Aureobasidium melanogenum]
LLLQRTYPRSFVYIKRVGEICFVIVSYRDSLYKDSHSPRADCFGIFDSAKASRLLLLADTDGATTAASGLGVLTTDAEAPVVAETSVGTDLLQSLKVLTELGVDTVSEDLEVLAVDNVALSVEEPRGDLVLGGVLDDGDDALELFRAKCVPLAEVDIGLLADQVGVAATDTLDLGQGVHDLLLAINLVGRIVGMRTLVLSRRRMNWKFDFSPETSDIVAVDERCYCWRREYNQNVKVRSGFWQATQLDLLRTPVRPSLE